MQDVAQASAINAARYLRKSRSDDPREDVAATLRRHRVALDEFAQQHRIVIVKDYEEVVTGDSLFERPQMLHLLSDVEKGLYDAVICIDIDRLGRGDMKDQGIILETFKYSKTKIITLEKTYDLNDELDEEMTEYKTFMSRREYKMINKRLQRGIRQTVKEGAYISNPPYGYERATVDKKPTLKIKEDEAYFVRTMFDLYVNHGAGCSQIADRINAMGAKPRRSAVFGRGTVEHIIKNQVYIGKIVWNRTNDIRKGKRGNAHHISVNRPEEEWITVAGIHPPIIEEPIFLSAQEILKGRYHPPCNTGEIKNPLAGVLICQQCGGKMIMQGCRGRWWYLRCITRGCKCVATNLDYVQDAMLSQLEEILVELESNVTPPETVDTLSPEKALQSTRKNLALATAQKSKLYDLLEQGVYTVDTFVERTESVDAKLKALRLLESEQARELAALRVDKRAERIKKIRSILKVYTTSDASQKNGILKETIDKIIYNKELGWATSRFDLTIHLK